jgi:ATP-binding cassette, subfamily B, bacterial
MRAIWAAYRADAITPRWYVVRQLPLAGLPLVLLLGFVNLLLGVLPVGFVIASSVVVGRVPAAVSGGSGSPGWDALLRAFLIASACFIGQQLLAPVQSALGMVMRQRVDGRVHARLMDISLRSIGIGPMEDQDNLTKLRGVAEQLESGWATPGAACSGTMAYIARYTRLAGFVILIGVIASWWAALGVFVSTMIFRYAQRGGLRQYNQVWRVVSAHRRERDYFRDLGLFAPAAKELRIFGATEWVLGRYRKSAESALAPFWARRRQLMRVRFLWYTAFGLIVQCTVLALVARAAAQGELTLTQLTLVLQAIIATILLGEFFQEADGVAQFGMNAVRDLDDFDQAMAATAVLDIASTGSENAAGLPDRSIRFSGVSFAYPGSTRPVLNGFDLTLRAGECTAIVGLNGAGKTTLVKLLSRLYEPTAGTLEVDGRDARDYTIESWRRQIAVIFQDFNRYELSVTDNIGFGAVYRQPELANIALAASKAGISDVIEGLPRGYDTMLARQYDDGADLSGGEWQRVAIARALYAVDAGARVLVLDEPTAALDVRAEAAFFDQFVDLTRGVTSLLISHRFSSVRRADRIVVLEHGRVVEDGTHDSLVAQGGRYADLFHLQAERFAAGLDAEAGEDE